MMRPHVPETLVLAELRNLRRYAYCLLGNRSLSDMAVEAALTSLVSDIRSASGTAVSRLDLYRRLNECIKTSALRDKVRAGLGDSIHTQVLNLPLPHRMVVVLYAVIGLPYGDVAAITGLSEGQVKHAYAEALMAMRRMPATVLIIEDEALIARELQQIVTKLGLTVAGMAKNKAEALRIAGFAKPRLILADYQLKQGETGVDVVRAIREQMEADVIYVTAHPETVVAQRDASSDIVISKPFNARSIERAVQLHMAA